MNPRMRLILALVLLRASSANVVEWCDIALLGTPQEVDLARQALVSHLRTLRRRAKQALMALV